MKILIGAAGSHGDILPFIAIARELQQRGHEVQLFGSGNFSKLADEAGVPLTVGLTSDEYTELLTSAETTDPIKGLSMLSRLVIGRLRPTFEQMRRAVEPGRTLVVGSSLAWATRLVGEVERVPVATVHLAPSWFRSEFVAPAFSPMGHLAGAPRFVKRWIWQLMDRRFLDPLFTQPFNLIRRELGLPAVHRLYHHWIHQADLTLGLFPDWFAPPQPDWPQGLKLTGFPLYDHGGEAPLPTAVQAFLEAGPPPIAFTAGTANASSHAFFEQSIQACRLSGRRGLLITQDARQLPTTLPDGVAHFNYVPFKALLPRLAAFVHHGGIGTTSQAMLAGVPQLIRPMGYDQFDNACRAIQLGVARQLLPRRYRAAAVAKQLDELIASPDVRSRCTHVAARLSESPSGVSAACDAILTMA